MTAENKPTIRRPFTHPLYGANLKTLLKLKSVYGDVLPEYRLQWTMAILSASARSPFTLLENFTAKRSIKKMGEMKPPIFIIGHWRSGTTHLGNILSKSPQFGYVSPLATGLPWNILTIGKWFRPLLERALPSDRLIDRVKVKPDSPQEDAFGIANMQTISFAHGFYFTDDFECSFNRGVFLDNCTNEEIDEWKRMHKFFLQKVYVDQNHKRLIIRNPAYTTRIPMLKKMWPGAKFIHIHRNPYRVYQSMKNFYDKLFPALSLQKYQHINIDEIILKTYERLMDIYLEDSKSVDRNELIEISYHSIEKSPIQQMNRIYEQFELKDFDRDQDYYTRYLKSIKKYKKNIYEQSEEEKERILVRWRKYIEHWNYTSNIQ